MPNIVYPIGIQSFSKLRNGNCYYVDKTALVHELVTTGYYYFLSRPRRFGKSLLISTLHEYFKGNRELFKGLAIDRLESDEWPCHPVLHIDFNGRNYVKYPEILTRHLHTTLLKWADELEIQINRELTPDEMFSELIERAVEKTGRQVVVLIDEYDAPLLDVVHEEEDLPTLRNVMRNFYSPLKACDPYLRFVFLTGITKFSQLSIFSELNNIKNISMLPEYATVCGISEEEIRTQMAADLEMLAGKLGTTPEEAMRQLKENYDGYHFTWPSPDIYNPYSLLNAFSDGKLGSYWFGSGTPTYLIEMLNKFDVPPSKIGGTEAMASDFDAPTERMTSIVPLLYQSGYITIKDYDVNFDAYTLDIPNKEVRIGLMRSLIPYYITPDSLSTNSMVIHMARAMARDDMDGMLQLLQTFLSTIPYCERTDTEGHYQQVLYIIFSLLGYYADVEVRTPQGRVDVVLRTPTTLYLIEAKLNRTAKAAMQQINLKNYPERFALCGLPVVKVGINFDLERETLGDWDIEK